jgi:glycerate kinase
MMHILIAPNAFKNAITAPAAAEAIAAGLRQSGLSFTHECFPIGDGGNGTAGLLISRNGGEWTSCQVHDPLGREITAGFGLMENGQTAVIEMADASGLQFLKTEELNPLQTTTFGCGEMIRQALDKGVRKIILGMGGSATVDGGAGILRALGIRFLDESGTDLPDQPGAMTGLAAIDLSGMDKRFPETSLIILCDVNNPLLGSEGAAAVFGPQKGAGPKDIPRLESALLRLKDKALAQTGKDMSAVPYAGTAGGAAAGLSVFLNASLVNGIDYFLETTGFEEALSKSNLVITGEGSIDEQTLQGKGPFGVADQAKKKGIPVIALAGKVPLTENKALSEYFSALWPIGNGPADLDYAMKTTTENLTRTSAAIGHLLSLF